MNKILSISLVFFGCFLLPIHAAIQLTWAHTDELLFDFDESTLLKGSEADPSIGFFIQLIKGNPVALDLSAPNALGSGNTLVGSKFIGFGRFEILSGGSVDGEFDVTETYATLNTGDQVFVRLWNAPSPNFASEFAPIPLNSGTATHYGNSNVHTINDGGTGIDSFLIISTATSQVIPEPSTLITLLAGVGILSVLRKRFRVPSGR